MPKSGASSASTGFPSRGPKPVSPRSPAMSAQLRASPGSTRPASPIIGMDEGPLAPIEIGRSDGAGLPADRPRAEAWLVGAAAAESFA
jgi:hypothetical protein